MSFEIGLLLAIIGLSVLLFAIEIIPADVIGMGVLIALILSGLLPPEDAFAGFGSSTFILLLGLLIMAAALIRTGLVELVGSYILKHTGENDRRLLWMIMIAVAVLSAFISNTAATAFFVPVAIGLAKRTNSSPSKLLMPLAFASILSSPVTLISSSSNIVISGLMTRYDLAPLGMFEMTAVGLVISVVGLAYMYFIGRRLIPDRKEREDLQDQGSVVPYTTEIVVLPGSPLIGRPLDDLGLDDKVALNVVQGAGTTISNGKDIQEGDTLLVEAQRDELLKIKDAVGIDFKVAAPETATQEDQEGMTMVEAIVLPGSSLIGQTLKRLRFRERFGIQVMGLHRSGRIIRQKISQTRLRVGDQLVLQAEPEKIALLGRSRTLRIIGQLDEITPNRSKAPLAVVIFIGSLVIGSIGWVSLAVAVLVGAFLMLASKVISPDAAYREVEWKALILIGSMLAVGQAMESSGTAQFIATGLVSYLGHMPAWVLLSAFFVLTLLLTQPMSNQAAAVVVIPIALQTAMQLGLNPRTFAVMVAVAASCSYLTPLEPSCMMVYGPGRYKFFDFFKVGSILTILIFVISILMVPMIWPISQ